MFAIPLCSQSQESYAILSSEEERRFYDWSLARSDKPDRYVWPFEVDITQTPTQPPPPQVYAYTPSTLSISMHLIQK